jgi:hypothetical protein
MVADLVKNFTTIYITKMLITGRQEAGGLGRIISLYLSKIQVEVIDFPTPELREEQLTVNTVFSNIFLLFPLTKCHVEWIPNIFLVREVLISDLDLKACSLAWRVVIVSLQTYAAIGPQNKPRPLPYASFPFHCLLVVLMFDAVVTLEKGSQKKKNSTHRVCWDIIGWYW